MPAVRRFQADPFGPDLFDLDAFGTKYRGILVAVAHDQDAVGVVPAETSWIVAVEPAGRLGRTWMTFTSTTRPLHQSYVEEKFGVKGEDAIALTVLIAEMLGREAVTDGDLDD